MAHSHRSHSMCVLLAWSTGRQNSNALQYRKLGVVHKTTVKIKEEWIQQILPVHLAKCPTFLSAIYWTSLFPHNQRKCNCNSLSRGKGSGFMRSFFAILSFANTSLYSEVLMMYLRFLPRELSNVVVALGSYKLLIWN